MGLDFSRIKTYSIKKRKSKVTINCLAKIGKKNQKFKAFLGSLPKILAASSFTYIVDSIVKAKKNKKPVIVMIGGHVIKCGLGPILIELMKRKVITCIAMNGAASIHDFEIGFSGNTSEDVADSIKDGSFGMADETGRFLNTAIQEGVNQNIGAGESLGRKIIDIKAPFLKYSVLANAFLLNVPATVHIAIGTDIIHQHPVADGGSLGKSSFIDFKKLANEVSKLRNGGVVINIGSAVIMPEVFLKALTIARNLGYKVKNFTAVNFDMLQHYRPNVNVLQRPTNQGGKYYSITGHHEIMIPMLAQAIVEKI